MKRTNQNVKERGEEQERRNVLWEKKKSKMGLLNEMFIYSIGFICYSSLKYTF